MASYNTSGTILPQDLMLLQLGQIDLLMAMYPSEDGDMLDESSTAIMQALKDWCDEGSDTPPTIAASSISLPLKVEIPESNEFLYLDISVPLEYKGPEPPEEPPSATIRMRQATWMTKAKASQIWDALPEENDLITAIENIKEAMSEYLSQKETLQENSDSQGTTAARAKNLVRVWFYFPSISTRSKRDDLVNHAPGYGLTGFLLAGKPGILCLEGDSQDIDDYMKFIKTESWGDIPAHHKKVTERYRQEDVKSRVFRDFTEITDTLGARRGERQNRNDMKALEAWLEARGLGEVFNKILI